MANTILIGFFREEDIRRGEVYWKGKYYDDIRNKMNVYDIYSENTKDAVAYLLGKDNREEKCVQIYIQDVYVNPNFMKIKYIAGDKTGFNSEFVNIAVRNLLPPEVLKGPYLPLCVKVDKDSFDMMIDDETLIFKINELKKKNNWLGIYNLTGSIKNVKEKKVLWDNELLLDGLSFATAKLSETYINLKHNFKTDEERKTFLAVQNKYREETVELRKRCIELNPFKAAYYSNLGYSYYQFTRELMLPGGRRDGKIMEEAEKAIQYIEKALSIDPQRIPDLYRKGQILAVIMPPQILFGGKNSPGEDAIKEAKQKINDGIECFKKIEEAWQILPAIEDKMVKRYQKEYIKSLYDTARACGDLAGDAWDITQYLLPLKYEKGNDGPGKYAEEKITLLDKAIAYMEKCAAADNADYFEKFPLPPVKTLCRYNGVTDGTHKLYSMGKYYFQKYLILTGCDEAYFTEADHYRKTAEEYLTAAMRFPSKPENARQSKSYIAEKLARVYISGGEYEKAIEVLKKYINDYSSYYIRYTYATACALSGRYEEAGKQTEKAMKNERSNFEMWLGYYLMYIKNLKENNLAESEKYLKMSGQSCRKAGKKNPASLLIGQAYISYKQGNREEAIKCLRAAEEISPGRKGIREKIRNWEEKRD